MGVSYNPRIVTDGLVFCVDAANPRSYPGAGTAWTDLTSENNNVTLVNGPVFDSENGGSILFDGTDDYGWFNRNGGTNFDGKDEISICTWVNYQSTGSIDTYIMMEDRFEGDANEPVRMYVSSSGTFRVDIDTGGADFAETDVIVATGLWFNISMTYDGSFLKHYINSNLITSTSANGNIDTPIESNARWLLGCGEIPFSRYSNTKMSLVQIYNRALSAQEIKQNYKATKGRFEV